MLSKESILVILIKTKFQCSKNILYNKNSMCEPISQLLCSNIALTKMFAMMNVILIRGKKVIAFSNR